MSNIENGEGQGQCNLRYVMKVQNRLLTQRIQMNIDRIDFNFFQLFDPFKIKQTLKIKIATNDRNL